MEPATPIRTCGVEDEKVFVDEDCILDMHLHMTEALEARAHAGVHVQVRRRSRSKDQERQREARDRDVRILESDYDWQRRRALLDILLFLVVDLGLAYPWVEHGSCAALEALFWDLTKSDPASGQRQRQYVLNFHDSGKGEGASMDRMAWMLGVWWRGYAAICQVRAGLLGGSKCQAMHRGKRHT